MFDYIIVFVYFCVIGVGVDEGYGGIVVVECVEV